MSEARLVQIGVASQGARARRPEWLRVKVKHTQTYGEVERLLRAFDADQVVVELHDPIFMVGDLTSGRFYRSQSMPDAEELAALVETLVE